MFLPSWTSREYTLSDKVDLWRGKFKSRPIFWDEFMTVDMHSAVTELGVPVYFFQGRYDYTTNYNLARDYFSVIEAPVKGFYTFKDSAHSPFFEEPDRMRRLLRDDILSGTTYLADSY